MQKFLPVVIVHVVIQDFRTVGKRRRARGGGDGVEHRPQRFKDFPIYNPRTWYIVCGPTVQAIIFMAMYVEQTNCMQQFDMVGDVQEFIPVNPLLEVLVILTVDVINVQDFFYSANVAVRQCFSKRPVHIHLLLPLLKVHHRAGGEAPVTGASMTADAGDVRRVMRRLAIQYCTMPVACRLLIRTQSETPYLIPKTSTYTPGFFGYIQMFFIALLIGHESLPACEMNVGHIILLFEMVGSEIAITHKASHVKTTVE